MKGVKLTEQVEPSSTLDIGLESLLRNLPRHIIPHVPRSPLDTSLVSRSTSRQDQNQPTPTSTKQGDKVRSDCSKHDDAGVVPPLTVVGFADEFGKDRTFVLFFGSEEESLVLSVPALWVREREKASVELAMRLTSGQEGAYDLEPFGNCRCNQVSFECFDATKGRQLRDALSRILASGSGNAPGGAGSLGPSLPFSKLFSSDFVLLLPFVPFVVSLPLARALTSFKLVVVLTD